MGKPVHLDLTGLPQEVRELYKDVTFEIQMTGKDEALSNLEKNLPQGKKNRPQRASGISRYAQAIILDEWDANGETIKFDGKDRMIDGQHRNEAVVEADEEVPGIKVPFLVVKGLNFNVFDSIDQGIPRTVADTLAIAGNESASVSAVAIRVLWLRLGGKRVSGGGGLRTIFARKLLKDHPGLTEMIEYVMGLDKSSEGLLGRMLSLGYIAALSYLAQTATSKTKVKEFLKRLADGEDLKGDDPLFRLRTKFLGNMGNRQTKLKRDALVGLFIKAFNAWSEDEKISSLALKDGEYPRLGGLDSDPEPEPEPEPEVEEKGAKEEAAVEPAKKNGKRKPPKAKSAGATETKQPQAAAE